MTFAAAVKNELPAPHDRLVMNEDTVRSLQVIKWLHDQVGKPGVDWGYWHGTIVIESGDVAGGIMAYEFFIKDKGLAVMFKLTFQEHLETPHGDAATHFPL